MALLDHFHPPLNIRRHWHAFHNAWATYLASDLNQRLPEGYFAEPNVQFGIQIDVATFKEPPRISPHDSVREERVAYLPTSSTAGWTPPAPVLTVPFNPITDIVEVSIYHTEGGPILVGAIELVSPANKDRPAQRNAFVSKCATYLQQGVRLVVVDIVTGRKANLHNELLARLATPGVLPMDAELYAVAYRPIEYDGQPSLDIWPETLTVGGALPTLPLWLRGDICVPVDLDATYERTCREQRIAATEN
ncbi:MAG: DUF4058 domain-containing protein [Chloroflexi bacterium RBG_16_57_9]|nr:MAG: DUF4058 domain-containing protein [Chloroflexi bacterium RBG_16_57_9]